MSVKGGTYCAVPGCSSKTGGKNSFFRFPKDESRCKVWLTPSKRRDLLVKSSEEIYKNYRVCEKHFDLKQIINGPTRKRLFDQAFSNIFPRSEEEPLEKITVLSVLHKSLPFPTASTQTSSALSNSSPRKEKLRRKIKNLRKNKQSEQVISQEK